MKAIINGIVINYDVSGPDAAPAVVLHHPLATHLGTWDALTASLNKTYRVIRFDARGHGASAAPAGPYTFETLSTDVIALMDFVGVKKAHFLGLSMGGMIGQYLGLLHPDRFHSLTLVSTSSATPPGGEALWEERIKNSLSLGMTSVVDGAMVRWVAPSVLSGKPGLVQRLKGMITDTPAPGYAGWCGAIRALNVTERLPAIKLPTLVVVGALDPATPPAAAEVIHKQIAGSKLAIMPGVSHMLQEEEPAAFAAIVVPFLASVSIKA
jgi:3-oxoadipate enol-lactonase